MGPTSDAYSTNAIEGQRFSLGVQTSNDFSRKMWLSTFAAYGTMDRRWKYGASAEWILRKSPRTELFFEHTRDIDQLGMMGFFDQGNGLNSALQLDTMDRLSEVTRTEMSLLHEFGSGWGQSVEFRHRSVAPRGEVLVCARKRPHGHFPPRDRRADPANAVCTKREICLRRIRTRQPRLQLAHPDGHRHPGHSLASREANSITNAGPSTPKAPGASARWAASNGGAQGGMYTGRAPVVLTELQPANETALSINEAFNLLRFMEFASDRWARGCAEWHGEGLLLGRLPGSSASACAKSWASKACEHLGSTA